jgi:2,4-dienoyl-CoA reductase-like NADH-dependent reductase (Old Yellow Enzyme family)
MVTRLSGTDGHVNDAIIERYLSFARGGVGLIVVEATAVHGAKSGPLLRLGADEFVDGHRRLVARVRGESNSRIVPQIIHFMKVARSGWRQTIDSLSHEDIDGIVDAFAAAAARARTAGYDGVELHSAHAYTLASFLSRKNPRRDLYDGRSATGRLRMLTRVYEAVRRAVGDDWTIGIRFLVDESIKGGSTVEDARRTAEYVARLGMDYISLSIGGKFEDAIHRAGQPLYPYTGYSGDRCMPDHRYPACANIGLMSRVTEHLRARGLDTPVLAAGKISTREEAEEILESGRADIIGMARQLLADPSWPRKHRAGTPAQVVRCIYCNVCKQLDENFREVRCFLWPRGHSHAPASAGGETPTWPDEGAQLQLTHRTGEIRLEWSTAKSGAGLPIARYEVSRLEEGSSASEILGAVKSNRFIDREALPGKRYTYCVHAFDSVGRGTEASNTASIDFESDLTQPSDSTTTHSPETRPA